MKRALEFQVLNLCRVFAFALLVIRNALAAQLVKVTTLGEYGTTLYGRIGHSSLLLFIKFGPHFIHIFP